MTDSRSDILRYELDWNASTSKYFMLDNETREAVAMRLIIHAGIHRTGTTSI